MASYPASRYIVSVNISNAKDKGSIEMLNRLDKAVSISGLVGHMNARFR